MSRGWRGCSTRLSYAELPPRWESNPRRTAALSRHLYQGGPASRATTHHWLLLIPRLRLAASPKGQMAGVAGGKHAAVRSSSLPNYDRPIAAPSFRPSAW